MKCLVLLWVKILANVQRTEMFKRMFKISQTININHETQIKNKDYYENNMMFQQKTHSHTLTFD